MGTPEKDKRSCGFFAQYQLPYADIEGNFANYYDASGQILALNRGG
jgi:hypothetical protein